MRRALLGLAGVLLGCDSPAPVPSQSAGEISFRSVAVELPLETRFFPEGPSAEVLNANCTACHSASMTLTQPDLTVAQWEGVVSKMAVVHKAAIADSDVPVIVAHLVALQSADQ